MKSRCGFTLIEVLAIIVVLGIISVITVPIALNNIEKARKNAALNSAFGIKRALEQYYYSADMSGSLNSGYICSFPDSCGGISYDGQKPTEGRLVLDKDGVVSGYVVFDKYFVVVNDDQIYFSDEESYDFSE